MDHERRAESLHRTAETVNSRFMFVGINYPWVACGHDFGDDPKAWGGPEVERDFDQVARDFEAFRTLGLTVVRMWVLAGGVNLPEQDWSTCASLEGSELCLSRPLPKVSARFVDDFCRLLEACRRAELKLMPSLLSFEFFQPAVRLKDDVVKRGRAGFVFGQPDSLDHFLEATLSPLLEASKDYRDALFAWEVINEPDWVVKSGPRQVDRAAYGYRPSPRNIAEADMNSLLRRGVNTIVDHGFTATIGFKEAAPKWVGDPLWKTLKEGARDGHYLHQLHHYPTILGDRRLSPHQTSPIKPCIVGEFPTAAGNGLSNVRWRDRALRDSERDDARYLQERLGWIEQQGYPGALLWAARATDNRSAWTLPQQEQTAAYLKSVGLRGQDPTSAVSARLTP